MSVPVIRCARCGDTQPAPPTVNVGAPQLRAVVACAGCLGLIVRDQGEMHWHEDRADVDEWGHTGWA